MAETSVSSLLNQVWAEFRSAGITDDLQIIEAVAALLLEQEGVSPDANLPRKPKAREFDESQVREYLQQASGQAGGAGPLFDRHVLFHLPNMRAGGQYPTPRHIVRLMVALAETQGQTVADFACGSAGLLLYSEGTKLSGVEISPEWARLARANLHLHALDGEIREGNALRVVKEDEGFSRIVMNPPFGAKIKSDFGARSETALTMLALERLASGGRMAVLAPSGLLFSGSQAEYDLRKRLVDNVRLEAIITLPDDAFQPYSSLATHLILVEKVAPAAEAVTWFLHPVYDGYVSGRGRDLTQEPQTPNDLTLVEEAFAAIRQPSSPADGVPIDVQSLQEGDTPLGVLFRSSPGVHIVSVRYLPGVREEDPQESRSALLLLVLSRNGASETWQYAIGGEALLEPVEDEKALNQERLGRVTPLPDIFQVQSIRWGAGVADAQKHIGGLLFKFAENQPPQLMGVAIPRAALRARDYALQPEDFLRAPEISPEQVRPHDLLRQIYERQQAFGERMKSLAGWLVPEGPKEWEIPSPVMDGEPFGTLSSLQKQIWQWIAAQKDGNSAKPFTWHEIAVAGYTEDEKRLALAIFEAMGLIVPITLQHPQSEQMMNFYRLVEQNDLWAGMEDNEPETDGGES